MSNRLLARLCVVYGQPDSPDPVAYLHEISNLIGRYSDTELEKAGDAILRNHRGRSFPTPSEIAAACADARASNTREVTPESKVDPAWSNARVALADKLIRTPIGRTAADEGWILSLHDFIRVNGRLPEKGEVGALRSKARSFDDAYASVLRGEAGSLSASLRRLGETFLAKRDKYSRMTGDRG